MLLRRGSLAEFGHLPLLAVSGAVQNVFLFGFERVMAGRGLGGGATPKHESPGRKVIYNQPYAPGAAGRAGGRAGRRSPPRAIWCCTAARDAAESALSSLIILAHKLMNPKQSPSPF